MFQERFRAKSHEPILYNISYIIAKRLKQNVARIFVRYMVDTYIPLSSVWHGDSRKEGDRYLEEGLESL